MYETYLQNERDFEEKFEMNTGWGIDHSAGEYGLDVNGWKDLKSHNRLSLIKVMKALEEELEGGNKPVPCNCPKGGMYEDGMVCDRCGGTEWVKEHICAFNDGEQDCECFEKGLQLSLDKIRKFIKQIEE